MKDSPRPYALLDFDAAYRCFNCEERCAYQASSKTLHCGNKACGATGEVEKLPSPLDPSQAYTRITWTPKQGANHD